jgi:hypothetical protein
LSDINKFSLLTYTLGEITTGMKRLLITGLGILFIAGCQQTNPNWKAEVEDPALLRDAMTNLTKVIVHDIFSPPVASRIYAYSSIAAYECARFGNEKYVSMTGQLTGLESLPQPEAGKEYAFSVAALTAFHEVGKKLIFSEDMMEDFRMHQDSLITAIRIPPAVRERSEAFGKAMAEAVIQWAAKDNYNQTRSFPKFTVEDLPGRWKPTPPAYMDGIEPSWRDIRPFVIDSAQQFRPPVPSEFNTDPASSFFRETLEVYETVNKAGEEEKAIASFWDCNPYVMNITGHVMVATKKITPGGHWMEITSIANQNSGASVAASAEAYARVAISLADAFISCWDEKYRSNLIRPETVINAHIDPDWKPLLQTPPFPEYTSGHSVISTAAAVCLTDLYGDHFAFLDDSEMKFGLPPRQFASFLDASGEAAISRLYGGIHYMPAISNGVEQGKRIGEFIVKNLNTSQELE